MNETPSWVAVEDVIALNKAVVLHTDEPHGITHYGGLESAVNRPEQHYNYGPEDTADDVVLLGVKLCVGISESQAFIQGNKRTGFAAMDMFFQQNGYIVDSSGHGRIAELILHSAHPNHSRRLSDEDFADNLDAYVVESGSSVTTGGAGSYSMTSIGSMNVEIHKAGEALDKALKLEESMLLTKQMVTFKAITVTDPKADPDNTPTQLDD